MEKVIEKRKEIIYRDEKFPEFVFIDTKEGVYLFKENAKHTKAKLVYIFAVNEDGKKLCVDNLLLEAARSGKTGIVDFMKSVNEEFWKTKSIQNRFWEFYEKKMKIEKRFLPLNNKKYFEVNKQIEVNAIKKYFLSLNEKSKNI